MVSGGVQEILRSHSRLQRGGLNFRPAVGVEDGGTDRLQLLVQGDQVLHLAAHDDTADVLCRNRFGELPGNFAKSRPPVPGSLLLKAVPAECGQFHGAGEDSCSRLIDKCAFDGGGARVKRGDVCHGELLLYAASPWPALWAMTARMMMPPVMMFCI